MKTELKQRLAFALIMGFITTGVITFTLIGLNLGFGDLFLFLWIRSWLIADVIAIFSIFFLGPPGPKVGPAND